MSVNAGMPFIRLTVVAIACSIALAPVSLAKHAAFELPACDRLMDGDGPGSKPQPSAQTTDGKALDLSPMKLTDESDSYSLGKDGKMKARVQENVKAGADKAISTDTSESVVHDNSGNISDKVLKDARKSGLMPGVLLTESDDEKNKKASTISDAERSQLTDLWTATINRSPDIQFVIGRMMPNTDQSHATGTAVRMLGGALFSIVQAAPYMMGTAGNPGMFMATGAGASMIQQMLSGSDQKNAKKQQISQEQATILYKIVRETADKVVYEYRKFKKCHNDYDRAISDLEDLKEMVKNARSGQDAAKQIEMEYTIRKAQRDVENVGEEGRLHRQQLADLAGGDAIDKLENEMQEEQIALQKLVGSDESGQTALKDPPIAAPTEAITSVPKPNESDKQSANRQEALNVKNSLKDSLGKGPF